MARLPVPGTDDGVWGEILNEYLTQVHATDGTLKPGIIGTTELADSAITTAKLAPTSVSTAALQDASITSTKLAANSVGIAALNAGAATTGQVLIYDGTGLTWATPTGSGSVPDATTTSKGLVQLAGDLGGTAAAPTVPGLAAKANAADVYTKTAVDTALAGKADTSALTAHTSDTTNPHSVTKAQVGLANVDNTSDLAKPVSTAQQTALDLKVDASALASVATSGSYADLTGTPTIPTATSSLTNDAGFITSAGAPVQSVAGQTGIVTLTKTDVGLGNVDNTSDLAKPVSTAQQTALDLKADVATTYTKTDVDTALSSKANTADVYTQTQIDTALGTKADTASLATVATSGLYSDITGTPTIPANVSDLTNDTGFITSAGAPVQSVAGKTGAVTLASTDITDFSTATTSLIDTTIPDDERVHTFTYPQSTYSDASVPSAYPYGVTLYSIGSSSGTTWPTSYAQVETVRSDPYSVQRMVRFDGTVWQRQSSITTSWDNTWQKIWPAPLDAPISGNGAAINSITATAWSNLPSSLSITKTFSVPTVVQINYGAWLTKSVSTADIRVGVAVSGGATSSPSEPNWGATLWAGAGSGFWGQKSATKTVTVTAGSTTFTMQAYCASDSGNANYPFIEIVPLRIA